MTELDRQALEAGDADLLGDPIDVLVGLPPGLSAAVSGTPRAPIGMACTASRIARPAASPRSAQSSRIEVVTTASPS